MNSYILSTVLNNMGENMAEEERFEEKLRKYIEEVVAVCTAEEGCECEVYDVEIEDSTARVRMGCPRLNGNLIRLEVVISLEENELASALLKIPSLEKTVRIIPSEYPEAYERLEETARCLAWALNQPIKKIINRREIIDAVHSLYETCMLKRYRIEMPEKEEEEE